MRNPAAPTIGRPVLASLGAAAAVGVVVFGVGAVDADAGWVVGTGIFGTVAGVLQWLVRKGQVHGRAGLAHLGGDGRFRRNLKFGSPDKPMAKGCKR